MQAIGYIGQSDKNLDFLQHLAVRHRLSVLTSHARPPLVGGWMGVVEKAPTLVQQFNLFVRAALEWRLDLFVVTDETLQGISNLPTLLTYASTLPRLAHLQVGGTQVLQHYVPNLIKGWWSYQAMKQIGTLDGTLEMVPALHDWAKRAARRGLGCFSVPGPEEAPIPDLPSTAPPPGGGIAPDPTPDNPRRWQGRPGQSPWAYQVTVVIPHWGPDVRALKVAVEGWRKQSIPTFIQIIDTGSDLNVLRRIRSLERSNVEVHSCRWQGQAHRACFAGLAYEHAMADCRTPYLIVTHNDVFPLSRTVAEELRDQCTQQTPVVGYRMSPRRSPRYKTMVGTVMTCVRVQVMDRIRATWNQRWLQMIGCPDEPDWPDVEVPFNESLRFAGIEPKLLGDTIVGSRQQTPHFEHIGGYTTALLYAPAQRHQMEAWADEVITTAESRYASWR